MIELSDANTGEILVVPKDLTYKRTSLHKKIKLTVGYDKTPADKCSHCFLSGLTIGDQEYYFLVTRRLFLGMLNTTAQ
jgi:hypothetical protein